MIVGAAVAVFHEDRVLLTKREDFEVWCLPGGRVDEGESPAQAAVREVREETGLDVRLTNLIGVYTRQGWFDLTVITFAAEVIGGELKPQASEVIDIGWFARDNIPADLLWGNEQRLADAFAGLVGVCRTVQVEIPADFPNSREAMYTARDESSMTRIEFYRWLLAQIRFAPNVAEVPSYVDGG